MIIAYDKTRFRGDLLIDDRPVIKGALVPAWEHVMFDAPYNRDVRRRFRLHGWDEAIDIFDRPQPTR